MGRLPFTFSRGDVDATLDALVAGLRPSETNPAEIRGLLKMRWPRNVINKLMRLLGDVSFSAHVVEQLHVSAALVSRHHRDYSLDLILSRAINNALSRLMPGPSKTEKELMRVEDALARLAKQNPEKASAQGIFPKGFVGQPCNPAEQCYAGNNLANANLVSPSTIYLGLIRTSGNFAGNAQRRPIRQLVSIVTLSSSMLFTMPPSSTSGGTG